MFTRVEIHWYRYIWFSAKKILRKEWRQRRKQSQNVAQAHLNNLNLLGKKFEATRKLFLCWINFFRWSYFWYSKEIVQRRAFKLDSSLVAELFLSVAKIANFSYQTYLFYNKKYFCKNKLRKSRFFQGIPLEGNLFNPHIMTTTSNTQL